MCCATGILRNTSVKQKIKLVRPNKKRSPLRAQRHHQTWVHQNPWPSAQTVQHIPVLRGTREAKEEL